VQLPGTDGRRMTQQSISHYADTMTVDLAAGEDPRNYVNSMKEVYLFLGDVDDEFAHLKFTCTFQLFAGRRAQPSAMPSPVVQDHRADTSVYAVQMEWDKAYTQRRIYNNGLKVNVTATDVTAWIDEAFRQQRTLNGSTLWEACINAEMPVHGSQVELTGTGYMLSPKVWIATKSIETTVLLMEVLLQGKMSEKERHKTALSFNPWELMLDAEDRGSVHTARDMQLSMGKLILRQAGHASQTVVGFDKVQHWIRCCAQKCTTQVSWRRPAQRRCRSQSGQRLERVLPAMCRRTARKYSASCATSQAWERLCQA
jgi:hypothetical protein